MSLKKQLEESQIISIAKECAQVLSDMKAKDILVMDLRRVNSYLDYFVICTGNSHIHCTALAKEVQKYFKEIGVAGFAKPRLDTGWIALDYNEIVVHIFMQDLRDYYQLDRLWGDADIISV